jgi:RNA polymerase sigma factor (sigma-70 family)
VRDFLYTAIEYMAADRWQREIPREDPLELDADQLDELLSPDVESDGGLEGQLVEQEQRDQFRRQLNAIVRELDPRVQQVIWLIDLEELPPREVRKRTGLSERQIRRYSEIGHKQLRRLGLAYLAEAYGSFCEQIASDVQTVAFTAGRYPQEQRLLEPAVARIDAHNASCEECRRKVAQLRRDRPELYRRMQRDLAILLPVPASALAASAATAKRGMLQRMLETLTGARQHAEGLATRPSADAAARIGAVRGGSGGIAGAGLVKLLSVGGAAVICAGSATAVCSIAGVGPFNDQPAHVPRVANHLRPRRAADTTTTSSTLPAIPAIPTTSSPTTTAATPVVSAPATSTSTTTTSTTSTSTASPAPSPAGTGHAAPSPAASSASSPPTSSPASSRSAASPSPAASSSSAASSPAPSPSGHGHAPSPASGGGP